MAETGTLHDAFIDELRDTYDAEKQLTKALPKLAKASSNPKLRQAFDLTLRFGEVRFEGLAQRGRRRRFGELGERLRQLLLGVVGVPQLVDECVVERARFGHVEFSS